MNLALLKPCCSRTEDKVGSTFNIAVAEQLSRTSHTGIYSVLMTEESTSYECQSVAFGVQCHRLS